MQSETYIIKNKHGELEELLGKIDKLSRKWSIPDDDAYKVGLAMDELITNTINYGYDNNDEHEIEINFTLLNNEVDMVISDDGREFDPLTAPEPDLTSDIDSRKIGGLGIFFVKKFMDEIKYSRENEKNILILKKKFSR
jgi:anti-sigma regulatory factor (Ser/Thr protein kinase)